MKGFSQLINKLKFRQQLLLMIVLPILGLIYYASINVIEKKSEFNEIRKVNTLTILCEKLSVLGHNIQEERSLFSIFHATAGAKLTELQDQFIKVDSTSKEVALYINQVNTEDYSENFIKHIEIIKSQADTIKNLRPVIPEEGEVEDLAFHFLLNGVVHYSNHMQ